MKRNQDITNLLDTPFTILVDGKPILAVEGESVLSALLASNIRQIMTNDYGTESGAYCGMGVCHCCLLYINGNHKQKACQTTVMRNMTIRTRRNLVLESGED